MVKGGDLHLGNTANIELDFPRTNLMNEIFGPGYSIDVLYIDKNYKLVAHTLVDRPIVAVLIDKNGLTSFLRMAQKWL